MKVLPTTASVFAWMLGFGGNGIQFASAVESTTGWWNRALLPYSTHYDDAQGGGGGGESTMDTTTATTVSVTTYTAVDTRTSSSSSLDNSRSKLLDPYRHSHPRHMRDIPEVPNLIERVGKEMYAAVSKPKYKFYFYMTTGLEMPDETAFCIIINMVCNWLYGAITLLGFVFLPRHFMLAATAVTLWIGPVLVLLLLGAMALLGAAFMLYPTTSVAVLWVIFFLPSRVAQLLGRHCGLDVDKDGDVDWLDLWHWVATQTEWGKRWPGLRRSHAVLNEWWSEPNNTNPPWQAMQAQLDAMQQEQAAMWQEISASLQQRQAQTSEEPHTPSFKSTSQEEDEED